MPDDALSVCITLVVTENEICRCVELGQRAQIVFVDIVVDKIARD